MRVKSTSLIKKSLINGLKQTPIIRRLHREQLKIIRYYSSTVTHNYLIQRLSWYRRWHGWERHDRFQYAAITISAVAIVSVLSITGLVHASGSTWTQTDWSGGVGSSTVNQYSSESNAVTTTANQVTMSQTGSPSWYNTAWKYRKSITLDNTTANIGTTAETLTNFPVLVQLNSTNFNFGEAQSAGQDIRFTASDGVTLLNYQIESWNSGTQQATIWVNVASIPATNAGFIEMYYGNSVASSGQNTTGTWNNSYSAVWHLDETSGSSTADSTSNANNGTIAGMSVVAGVFGDARSSASNSGNYITTPLNNGSTITIQNWATWSGNDTSSYGMMWTHGSGGPDLFFYSDEISYNTYDGAGNPLCTIPASANNGAYHLYTTVIGPSTVTLYYDGQLCGSATYHSPAGAFGISDSANDGYDWLGAIDEMRVSSVARDAAYVAADYKTESNAFDTFGTQQVQYPASSTLTSSILNTGVEENWGNLSYSATVPTNTTVSVLVRAGNQANLSDAPAFTACSPIASGSAITSTCAPTKSQYVQYQLQFTSDGSATPTFTSISIPYTASDIIPPPTNASNILAYSSHSGSSVASNGWVNSSPYFSWTAGADNVGGSGLAGYCLYVGTSSSGNPITSEGDLGTSPLNTNGVCPFAVSSNSVDLSTAGYLGTALSSSTSPYYINIVAIDNAGNVYAGSPASFQFRFDNTPPANPSFINAPSNFTADPIVDLTWPTTGSFAASDADSGVLGLQYKIGSSGTWYGAGHSGTQDCTDTLPIADGSYTTVDPIDTDNLVQGDNIVYFRTWDTACNVSSTDVTTVIKLNSTSPSTPQDLTATPTTNTTNAFAFAWAAPASFSGNAANITYCYTINSLPTVSNCTYTSAGTTSLASGAYATQPGDNTFYVVARDEAGNINYATAASTTFTANTAAPGVPLNMDIADISTKATQSWKLALSWNTPSTVGAGIASYKIYRSTDGSNYSQIASTAGTSYVDSSLNQQVYYYEVQACDSADNCGGLSSSVSLLPTGKFTSPASLISGPNTTETTRTATISFTTDRDSNSSVEYGLSSNHYFPTVASTTNQVTSHSVILNNLQAGTTYYYRALWADVDGNTGTSAEGIFTTLPAPTVSDVTISGVNLSTADIQFTSQDATAIKLYYGPGGTLSNTQTLNTSTSLSTYSIPLSGLSNGTTYVFRLDPFDISGNEYQSTESHSFTTPPAPAISNIQFSPVPGALTGTETVAWTTNVAATTQIIYRPQGTPVDEGVEALDSSLVTNHTISISNLVYNTPYSLTATSQDVLGNTATSDQQIFHTGLDTRPPRVSNVVLQPSIIGTGADAAGQIVVSWKTDKPGGSQVEYGQGSGGNDYTSKTAEDTNLVLNHVVVISGLPPAHVYHLKVLSTDSAGNTGVSGDQTTIVGQATDSVLTIILGALQAIYSGL